MLKKLFSISIIIFANLFAFLLIGIILGQLFGNHKQFLLGSIIVSIFPLVVFLFIETKKAQNDLTLIAKEKQNESNRK